MIDTSGYEIVAKESIGLAFAAARAQAVFTTAILEMLISRGILTAEEARTEILDPIAADYASDDPENEKETMMVRKILSLIDSDRYPVKLPLDDLGT